MTKVTKCIAAGTVLDNANYQVVASVYETYVADDESADKTYDVKLSYKAFNAAELPANPLSFDDIESEVGTMKVPALEKGKTPVTLEAPVTMKYGKTKAFKHNGKYRVMAALRYTF